MEQSLKNKKSNEKRVLGRKKLIDVSFQYAEKYKESMHALSPELNLYKNPKIDKKELLINEFPLLSIVITAFCKKNRLNRVFVKNIVNNCPQTEQEWSKRNEIMKGIREILKEERQRISRNPNNYNGKNNYRLMPITARALGLIARRKCREWLKENPYDVYDFDLLHKFRKREQKIFNNIGGKCSPNRMKLKKLQTAELLDMLEFTIKIAI